MYRHYLGQAENINLFRVALRTLDSEDIALEIGPDTI